MSRGLTVAEVAATLGANRIAVWFVDVAFISGTIRLTLGPWNIVVDGNTYISTGTLLDIKTIRENAGTTEGIQLTLSGIDPAVIAIATQEHVFGRTVRLLKGFLNPDTYQLIATPKPRWLGRVTSMPVVESNNSCQVTLLAEHYEAALARAFPIRLNNQEQKRRFPLDRGCEYVEQMIEKTIIWPSKEAIIADEKKSQGG